MQRGMTMAVIGVALAAAGVARADKPYDFRSSPSYRALEPEQRQSLEQVQHDFVLLWGALDLYMRDHDGRAPENLEALVPQYLRELPRDAFATMETATEKEIGAYITSRDGWGYRYRRGPADYFIIASVGLPEFPYLAESGNVGLYLARGIWLSGKPLASH